MPKARREKRKPQPVITAGALLALFVLLCGARLPFVNNVLLDEEGLFAYLVADNGDGGKLDAGNALLIGRVDHQDHWSVPGHPILPYRFFISAIRPLNSPADFSRLKMTEQTRAARRPFLLMFAVAMGLLFWLARWTILASRRRVLTMSILLFGCIMPLLVGGSIQPQLDGSWGVLLCVVAGAGLMAAGATTGVPAYSLAAASGFVASMGKNEWSLSLLVAMAAAFGLQISQVGAEKALSRSRLLLWLLLGILVGCAFSWWLSPSNFTGGFDVMHRFGTTDSMVEWKRVLSLRWTWIWPVTALLVMASVIAVRSRTELTAEHPLKLTVFFWGVALFAGFFATAWMGDGFPRYFCPAAVVLLCFLADALRATRVPRWLEITLVVLLLIGSGKHIETLWHDYTHELSISSIPGASTSVATNLYLRNYENFSRRGEPSIIGAAYGYYFPAVDFAVQSMGVPQAREALAHWKSEKQPDR